MRPRRTAHSDGVFRLEGGNEDNDLWVHTAEDEMGQPLICSVWEPTDEERQAIAGGQNVELVVWGTQQPPVSMRVVDYPLGAPKETPE